MTESHTRPNGRVSAVEFGDAELNARLTAGMDAVEALLRAELGQGEDFIVDKVLHLAVAGGKRFRPLMALLSSEFGSRPGSPEVVKAAVVVETVHLATLYHDDVMDEADRRRGVESANSRWDNSVAILAGDILLAHASRLMSELDTRTVRHFAETFRTLVTGQMRETIGASAGGDAAVEHYMKVITEKTGVLIASAGFLGALHSGASEEHMDALYKLGGLIGIIFQIVDDMIDIFSAEEDSGKTPGTDLREGVFTLPVLLALGDDSAVGDELRGLLTGPLANDADVTRALELLEASEGRRKTREVIETYVAQANEQIARLPESSATTALRQLMDYTVQRVG
ncbi:polyprenyl synthetase family protein [Corynebacterium uterequi]|uniref:Geranylgeranyl pyrophosphate synthase n=1 Tax=Corynebacterium uterequi TaxID=1072256 RepID=A0A0G3HGP9_9CORY|nr:polyprenyl synthetase family protein [Corynebacterium uterequi]AKK10307.1 geranylgeranyl pyrophosphate synthase [Corynebacterium uterequi]